MSKAAKSIFVYEKQNQHINQSQNQVLPFLLGKQTNKPVISCPIFSSFHQEEAVNPTHIPTSTSTPIVQEEIYHKNPKYGASKYISSLQAGKMHKLMKTNR